MANLPTIFDASSNLRIAKAVKSWEINPHDNVGLKGNPVPRTTGFWANIGMHADNGDGTFNYAWIRQFVKRSDSDNFNDLNDIVPDAIQGTTTVNFAINVWEKSATGGYTGPVDQDTIVWMEQGFDDQNYPIWRFKHNNLAIGQYCPTSDQPPDCIDNIPLFTEDGPVSKLYFSNYFNLFQRVNPESTGPCHPGEWLADWTGFTVQSPHYQPGGDPPTFDVVCQTRILQFVDPTSTPDGDGNVQPAPDLAVVNFNTTDSFDVYPVYWQVTAPTPTADNASCKCVGDNTPRNIAQLQAFVAVKIPPGCDGGFDVVTDVTWDGTNLNKVYQTVTVENGLITDCGTSDTAVIDTPSACP